MICFPNAKINIGLQITGKRNDGFHNLTSIFYPIAIKDVLEVLPAEEDQQESISFSSTGIEIPGSPANNLCIKAGKLLQEEFPQLPKLRAHLHKSIPMGAGIGGGSADGAFMLKLINNKFGLSLDSNQLIRYASALGSDCPFFIHNKPCIASGRGEQLEPIDLDLTNYKILLIHPAIHINTAWAFSKITINENPSSLKDAIKLPIIDWKNHLVNDFEKAVFEEYPVIEAIKRMLYQKGALFASMSGSGSTVYGIFDSTVGFQPEFPHSYFCKWI